MKESIENCYLSSQNYEFTKESSLSNDVTEIKVREYHSIKNIMQITGFSRSTIMRALKNKRLVSKKVKGLRVIKITDLEKFMEGDE